MEQKIKFYIKYDESYSHSFASGLQLSSVTKDRYDLSFHYEMAHVNKEIITTINGEGEVQKELNEKETIEIDRIIKTAVSIDRKTAENLLVILQKQLSDDR